LPQSSQQVGKPIKFIEHHQLQTQPMPSIPQNMNTSSIQHHYQVQTQHVPNIPQNMNMSNIQHHYQVKTQLVTNMPQNIYMPNIQHQGEVMISQGLQVSIKPPSRNYYLLRTEYCIDIKIPTSLKRKQFL